MARYFVYWDTNAFLGLINYESDKVPECVPVWRAAETGTFLIVTSALTVAEVIYAKGTPKLDPAKRERVNLFFRAQHLVLVPLTRVIGELSRDIVWDTPIKPKDAVHVATAAYSELDTCYTYDGDLLALGAVTVKDRIIHLKRPTPPLQAEMFNAKGEEPV